jgi:hypothetical protein
VLLIVLAALVVVGALTWLGLAVVRTWRSVKAFGRDVAAAGERMATASDALSTALDAADASRPHA